MMAAAAHPSPSVSPLPPQEQRQRNGVPEAHKAVRQDKPAVVIPVAPIPVPVVVPPPKRSQNLEAHYNDLLKIIAEIGKDVKPAYTSSKVSTDRLRKNITLARSSLKECLNDLEKLYGPTLHERNY